MAFLVFSVTRPSDAEADAGSTKKIDDIEGVGGTRRRRSSLAVTTSARPAANAHLHDDDDAPHDPEFAHDGKPASLAYVA